MQESFWLRLSWIPTPDNIEEFVRLRLPVFRRVWDRFGLCLYDSMGTAVSAQRVPAGWSKAGQPLPFFARFVCLRARGIDILAQDLVGVQRAYCFSPAGMVGVLIQRMYECRAGAAVILPDVCLP